MENEFKHKLTVKNFNDNLFKVKNMEREFLNKLMKLYIKDNLRKIKYKDWNIHFYG